MKIAEMEYHHDAFLASEQSIRAHVQARRFESVFSQCEDSLPHIVPAIRFRKKRDINPEVPSLRCINVVCKYAPLLFERDCLARVHDFITSNRALAKYDGDYLGKVEMAIEQQETARILWNGIAAKPGFLQRNIRKQLGLDRDTVVAILGVWEELGVVCRTKSRGSYRIDFPSRLDAVTDGCCPKCGIRGKARKELFLKPVTCRKCGFQGFYHIICGMP